MACTVDSNDIVTVSLVSVTYVSTLIFVLYDLAHLNELATAGEK